MNIELKSRIAKELVKIAVELSGVRCDRRHDCVATDRLSEKA